MEAKHPVPRWLSAVLWTTGYLRPKKRSRAVSLLNGEEAREVERFAVSTARKLQLSHLDAGTLEKVQSLAASVKFVIENL